MSISTAVAHLGLLRVRWMTMSSGFIRSGSFAPSRIMALIERLRNVHVRHAVAEFVRLGLLQLDGPFADDRPLMPAGAGCLQAAKKFAPAAGLERCGRPWA